MCGGLVGIASGARSRELSRRTWWQRTLAYNAGRIASYVAAGALTGALGAAGLSLRGTPLVQQTLLAFGLGTLPNLLAIGASFSYIARVARSRSARAVFAALIIGVGIFGIVRATHPLAHAAGIFSLSGKILASNQR